MTPTQTVLESYNSYGIILVPVKDKVPLIKWKDLKTQSLMDLKKLMAKYGTELTGWAISCGPSDIIVIDIDTKSVDSKGHDGLEQFIEVLKTTSIIQNAYDLNDSKSQIIKDLYSYHQRTPSGGYHLIFKMPSSLKGNPVKFYKTLKHLGAPNVDVQAHGGISVISPSRGYFLSGGHHSLHPDIIETLPDYLVDIVVKQRRADELTTISGMPSSDINKRYTEQYITELIERLKEVPISYHEWLTCGMALHSWDSGSIGIELYLQLSHGVSYKEGDDEECILKWASFSEGDTTIKSLLHVAKEAGLDIKQAITAADDFGGWQELNGKFYSDDEDFIVKWFNKQHLYYCKDPSFAENKRFLKVSERNGKRSITYGSTSGLNDMYPSRFLEYTSGQSTKIKNGAKVWAECPSRNEVFGVTFNPRSSKNVIDDRINLYSGVPIAGLREHGRDKIIWDMILESICGEDEKKYQWFMMWLAHMFQRPWEKPSTFPVIIGDQGTGKGFMTERILGEMLGNLFFITSSTKDIVGFNSMMGMKLLICLNEATWKNKHDLNNMLKAFSGDKRIVIDEKYKPKYEIENYARFIITSNSYDAIKYEPGNRRIIFLENGSKWTRNTQKFSQLKKEISSKNLLGKFYDSLMRHDITHFNPFSVDGLDYGGSEAKLVSFGVVAEFWYDLVLNPRPVFYDGVGFSGRHVYDEFSLFCHGRPAIKSRGFWAETRKIIQCIGGSKVVRIKDQLTRCFYSGLPSVILSVQNDFFRSGESRIDAYDHASLERFHIPVT